MRLSQPNGRAHRAHGKDRTRRTAAQRAAEDVVMTPNWTDERPTEPGEYWLSLHPNRRTVAASYPVGLERPVERVWVEGERLKTRMGWSMSLTAGWLDGVELLDGAKWSRRETPADPFEEG